MERRRSAYWQRWHGWTTVICRTAYGQHAKKKTISFGPPLVTFPLSLSGIAAPDLRSQKSFAPSRSRLVVLTGFLTGQVVSGGTRLTIELLLVLIGSVLHYFN